MKKIIPVLICALYVIGCTTSNEDKAKALINEYMKDNLKDPSSYEAVSYGQLDSLFFPFIDTEEGRELFDKRSPTGVFNKEARRYELAAISAKTRAERELLEDSASYFKREIEKYESLFKEKDEEYKGEFIGWIMSHEYRAKNSFGALDLDTKDFYFDKEFTEIVPPYGKRR